MHFVQDYMTDYFVLNMAWFWLAK